MQSFGALGQPVALCLFLVLGTFAGGIGFPLIFAYNPNFKTAAMQKSAESLCGFSNYTAEVSKGMESEEFIQPLNADQLEPNTPSPIYAIVVGTIASVLLISCVGYVTLRFIRRRRSGYENI